MLNLATMWFFQEVRSFALTENFCALILMFAQIRAKAISKLSDLIKQKKVMERIALAREYRVAEWLRDAYLELIQKAPSDFEELWPAEPHSNSEADAKKWEATSRDWETLARIFYLRTKLAAPIIASRCYSSYGCDSLGCNGSYSEAYPCKCRLLPMVDEAFRGELGSLKENPGHVEHPLTRKLPISYLCPLKKQLCIANSTNSAAPFEVSGGSKKKCKRRIV